MNFEEPQEPESHSTPWWETAAMIASFGLLWAFLLARQAALKAAATSGAASPTIELSPLWTLAQFAAIAALVAVFIRRMRRASAAMREATQGRPGLPPGFPAGGFGTNGRTHQNGHAPAPRTKNNGNKNHDR